jgi:ABC-2 type transport system ATP-binding protein
VSEILNRSAGAAPSTEVQLKLFPPGEPLEVVAARTERLLLEQPLVKTVVVSQDVIRVRLELAAGAEVKAVWVDEACARLLQVLVKENVPVCSFQTRELDLEDAFLHVTKGRVA